jgi:hypothetical protein
MILNILRITISRNKNDFSELNKIYNTRIAYLISSNIVNRRILVPVNGENIITHKFYKDILNGKTLVILLSSFKCSKCQLTELIRLDSLKKTFSTLGIKTIGITTNSKKDIIITQMKISRINFPIYKVSNKCFYNEISFSQKYPEIILVENNVIISSFIPIPFDTKMSEIYFSNLLNNNL